MIDPAVLYTTLPHRVGANSHDALPKIPVEKMREIGFQAGVKPAGALQKESPLG